MIGISAVVNFFALTGNLPCKYNNQFMVEGGKDWGDRNVIMYREPLTNVFPVC